MGDSFLECEQRFSLGGIELDGGDLDGLAVGFDAEGACIGCGAGEFTVKGENDFISINFSGVDVEGFDGTLGAVLDSKVGDGGEVVTGEILNDIAALVASQIAVAEGCLLYTSPSPRDRG